MQLSNKPFKLLAASSVSLPLAIICGAHGLSSASLRSSPEFAISVFPANGLAAERLAYGTFVDGVQEALVGPTQRAGPMSDDQAELMKEFEGGTSDLQAFAASASQAARDALALEPLLPKAHALLALAQTDTNKRNQIVALASRLNRREISLQGLVLQQKVEGGDYAGSIETLDQILRVHPERQAEFFPLLVEALARTETIPAFSDLLRNDLPWRDAFLGFAVKDPRTLENLAQIRKGISPDNLAFDQRLIAGLVAQRDIREAAAIYGLAVASNQKMATVSWQSDYPPFDWKLSDTSGLRARANKKLDTLEFSIEPGNGGILASKLISAPPSPFKIGMRVTNEPSSQIKDLKLQISCWNEASPFFEQAFLSGSSVFEIAGNPGCAYLQVAIAGRAWTGSNALAGNLGPLQLNPR
jgi:hypothetical protein